MADGFEQAEMTEPRKALESAGAETQIVSPLEGSVRGWRHLEPADTFEVDVPLKNANVDDFDALLLPGGVVNPDALRINLAIVRCNKAGQSATHFATAPNGSLPSAQTPSPLSSTAADLANPPRSCLGKPMSPARSKPGPR